MRLILSRRWPRARKRRPITLLSLLAILLVTGCGGERGEAVGTPDDPAATAETAQASEANASAPELEEPTRSDPSAEAFPAVESATRDTAMMSAAPKSQPSDPPRSTGPFTKLPAGASHESDRGFATIAVYYATDRARRAIPISAYAISGNRDALLLLLLSALAFLVIGAFQLLKRRRSVAIAYSVFGAVAMAGATLIVWTGTVTIEKHGVTYNGDRGPLVKGIAEVTVPDSHDRGKVERPSLLRFELREDQQKHIVLTSAIELNDDEFNRRLSDTIATSPDQDLLVFVHGFNVDFESAVQRTAQLAVDLPFDGVPVCYSWPSQGSVFGYTVDETNAAWTQSHLRQFLLDLARETNARSINVVAHSMGNRPTTGALVEIGWNQKNRLSDSASDEKLFDRVVLAAPDVDADRFRRDLAPALGKVADHVTLYASSDDQALIASKRVHGYPRAGESGDALVVVPGVETIDVSGIDIGLLGHSYYGDSPPLLHDLYQVVRNRLPANRRKRLAPKTQGELIYWQLQRNALRPNRLTAEPNSIR